MGKIKLLSDDVINQIAAGEIVESPSSALKEIVENSIDAGSKNIEIFIKNGGKSKIIVEDDGGGLSEDDLNMAVQRHATSKLLGQNLFDINSYGFRGEALASIAAVSNFSLESNNFGISVDFSNVSEIYPSSIQNGTKISVNNLFNNTPARLKFLKPDGVELRNCIDCIENFSLINNCVNFRIRSNDKIIFATLDDSIENRIAKIFSDELLQKAVFFENNDEKISVCGYLFHPLDSKYSSSYQKIFVNNRIVKDKNVSFAIKNAYRDLVPSGRFPVIVLFIDIDPFYVDVNVSPTKSEIRFRDQNYVQKFLTDSIKKNLNKFDKIHNFLPDTEHSYSVVNLQQELEQNDASFKFDFEKIETLQNFNNSLKFCESDSVLLNNLFKDSSQQINQESIDTQIVTQDNKYEKKQIPEIKIENDQIFGEPIAQLFDTFIVSKTKDDKLIIIDQHAVHEKITQNKIKKEYEACGKKFLIKSEIIEINEIQKNGLNEFKDDLKKFGFDIEFVQNTAIISAIPQILCAQEAVDFLECFLEQDEQLKQDPIEFISKKIANIACKNSMKGGRKLEFAEMKALLKEMETQIGIHQCNHHRPSFLIFEKNNLEKLFKRT